MKNGAQKHGLHGKTLNAVFFSFFYCSSRSDTPYVYAITSTKQTNRKPMEGGVGRFHNPFPFFVTRFNLRKVFFLRLSLPFLRGCSRFPSFPVFLSLSLSHRIFTFPSSQSTPKFSLLRCLVFLSLLLPLISPSP
jgi:hypothetical protein